MPCWLRAEGWLPALVMSVHAKVTGSHSQVSSKLDPLPARPPKSTILLRTESNTIAAPERARGPAPVPVRLVHFPVAGFHSQVSWFGVEL